MKDYYKILGVSNNATSDEIEKALAPLLGDSKIVDGSWEAVFDANGVLPNIERWEEVFEAYNFLSNTEKRISYDRKKWKLHSKIKKPENIPTDTKNKIKYWVFENKTKLIAGAIIYVILTTLLFIGYGYEALLVMISFILVPAIVLLLLYFALIGTGLVIALLVRIIKNKLEERKKNADERQIIREREKLIIQAEKEYEEKQKELEWQRIKEIRMAEYQKLRKEIEAMPKYANWKNAVLAKNGTKCEICGKTENLEIHHRQSFYSIIQACQIKNIVQAFEINALWEIDNGSVLCKTCHNQTTSSKYRKQNNL